MVGLRYDRGLSLLGYSNFGEKRVKSCDCYNSKSFFLFFFVFTVSNVFVAY